jgi:UDP-N-acetylmuramate: L-alanyl-gamma-D-glutamyl-meso-diaminopimelate ligase
VSGSNETEKLTLQTVYFKFLGQNSAAVPESLHFVAVGGSAMAPLAVLLAGRGHRVSGSDGPLYPPTSDLLARAGLRLMTGYRPENVTAEIDRVIIGNAVPRSNPEVEEVLRRGIPYLSMAEAIRQYLLPGRHSIVVTGTHGKTTTSALLAWLLLDSGRDPGFLIGGEMKNISSGFRDGQGPHFLLEGDEYNSAFFDREAKFLHYEPRTLLVNNIEFDHADLYSDLPALVVAFRKVIALVPAEGVLVANGDSESVRAVLPCARARLHTVSLRPGADSWAGLVAVDPAGTAFTFFESGVERGRLRSPLFGRHNLSNALAAIAAGRSLGLTMPEIASALPRFAGVKRRLEVLSERGGVLFVDDFAHHPTAVFETLSAARERWPGRRLWAVFEPRSLTAGRRFFQEDYERALLAADAVVLAPVFHAARFQPEELIDRVRITATLSDRGRPAFAPRTLEEIEPLLMREGRAGDVVILMSSGDFGGLRQRAAAD